MPEVPIDKTHPRFRDGIQHQWLPQGAVRVRCEGGSPDLSHCSARRTTHARCHENVSAGDGGTADRIARVCARGRGW